MMNLLINHGLILNANEIVSFFSIGEFLELTRPHNASKHHFAQIIWRTKLINLYFCATKVQMILIVMKRRKCSHPSRKCINRSRCHMTLFLHSFSNRCLGCCEQKKWNQPNLVAICNWNPLIILEIELVIANDLATFITSFRRIQFICIQIQKC